MAHASGNDETGAQGPFLGTTNQPVLRLPNAGAPPIHPAPCDLTAEWVKTPGRRVSRRNDVGMSFEHQSPLSRTGLPSDDDIGAAGRSPAPPHGKPLAGRPL